METVSTVTVSERLDEQHGENRPKPINVHVGSRIRSRRAALAMSQKQLGAALGVLDQQIEKYEQGVDRIAPSRMFDLSLILDIPISFFYDNPEPLTYVRGTHLTIGAPSKSLEARNGFGNADVGRNELLQRAEMLELAQAYYCISDLTVRKRLLELAKAMKHYKN